MLALTIKLSLNTILALSLFLDLEIAESSPSKCPDMNAQSPVGTIELLTSGGTGYLSDLGSNHV